MLLLEFRHANHEAVVVVTLRAGRDDEFIRS